MSSLPSASNATSRYQYYARFNIAEHYRAYCKVLNLLLPGKKQVPQTTPEELSQLLSVIHGILQGILLPLDEARIIDSHLPARLCIVGWDGLIRRSLSELRSSHRLSQYVLGSPLPGEPRFSLENPPNALEDYLLQQEVHVISGTPFLLPEDNTAFPSAVFTRFPTPYSDDEDDDEGEGQTMTIADAPSMSEPESAPFAPELLSPPSLPTTPAVPTAVLALSIIDRVTLPPVASLLSPRRPGAQSSTGPPLISQANATPTRPNLANLMEGHPATPPLNTNFNELARQMAETVRVGSPMPILTTPGRKPSSLNMSVSSRLLSSYGFLLLNLPEPLFASQTPRFNPALQFPLSASLHQASPLPPVVGQGDFNPTPVSLVPDNEPAPESTPVDEPAPPSPPRMYHMLS
ncbi:hypothetical protein IW262DRAFT_1303023, partial [Armillaria fumosa]